MTSISVVQFNAASPHKILQQNTTANAERQVIILRKPPPLLPQPAKRAKVRDPPKPAAQPVAVARRNARERNRVKQVNNGFANLRQHIPSHIAATFESSTRTGGSKKLSKVETLRMAVEYIRSLEEVLGTGAGAGASPLPPYQMLSTDEDDLSTNPTPPPYQYQILYDDSENMQPINVDEHILGDPALMNADLEFRGAQDLSILQGDSLSPGMYSEGSESSEFGGFEGVQVKVEEVPGMLSDDGEMGQMKSGVVNVMQWWGQHEQSA